MNFAKTLTLATLFLTGFSTSTRDGYPALSTGVAPDTHEAEARQALNFDLECCLTFDDIERRYRSILRTDRPLPDQHCGDQAGSTPDTERFEQLTRAKDFLLDLYPQELHLSSEDNEYAANISGKEDQANDDQREVDRMMRQLKQKQREVAKKADGLQMQRNVEWINGLIERVFKHVTDHAAFVNRCTAATQSLQQCMNELSTAVNDLVAANNDATAVNELTLQMKTLGANLADVQAATVLPARLELTIDSAKLELEVDSNATENGHFVLFSTKDNKHTVTLSNTLSSQNPTVTHVWKTMVEKERHWEETKFKRFEDQGHNEYHQEKDYSINGCDGMSYDWIEEHAVERTIATWVKDMVGVEPYQVPHTEKYLEEVTEREELTYDVSNGKWGRDLTILFGDEVQCPRKAMRQIGY